MPRDYLLGEVPEVEKVFLAVLVLLTSAMILPTTCAASSAVIQNDSSYIGVPSGYFHVVGEVKNAGDVWLQSIIVTATLKDQYGAIVAILQAHTLLAHLPPNAAAAFDLFEINETKVMTIKSYSLSVTFQESPPIPVLLRVSNVTETKTTSGELGILVKVDNRGDSITEDGVVVATFYGTDGRVVYVKSLGIPSIAQGGSASLAMAITDPIRASLVTSYQIAVESPPYTSIPELVWQPEIVLAVALTLGYVAIHEMKRLET
jgi:hypothetical protein